MNIISGACDELRRHAEFMAYRRRSPFTRGRSLVHRGVHAQISSRRKADHGSATRAALPSLDSDEDTIEHIPRAIEAAGYKPARTRAAMDAHVGKGKRQWLLSISRNRQESTSDEPHRALGIARQPARSASSRTARRRDWDGWKATTKALAQVQLVGDDLFVTNTERLKKASRSARQTLSHPVRSAVSVTLKRSRWRIKRATAVTSHRSGETETTIAGSRCTQHGTDHDGRTVAFRARRGQPARIEEELGASAGLSRQTRIQPMK